MSQPKLLIATQLEMVLSKEQMKVIQPYLDTLTDNISIVHTSCCEALDDTWDRSDDGFDSMIALIERSFETPPEYISEEDKFEFEVGDEVYWTDPGDDLSSGIYKVISRSDIYNGGETIYCINNGTSEAEVYECELSIPS